MDDHRRERAEGAIQYLFDTDQPTFGGFMLAFVLGVLFYGAAEGMSWVIGKGLTYVGTKLHGLAIRGMKSAVQRASTVFSPRGRLIPGTPGQITGGDSTKLGQNLLAEMGVPTSRKWTGYQARHIIPTEIATQHPVIRKIGMDLDDASNGIFLRIPDQAVSTKSRHRGYHGVYSQAVKKQLDRLDINKSVPELQADVFKLQQKLRRLQEKGLPLYQKQGATVDLWDRWLSK